MNRIYFVIGASGAGKTTTTEFLEKRRKDIKFCYLDKEGVIPSLEQMKKECGDPSEWQKIETHKMVEYIKENYLKDKPVIIDTQTRYEFIKNACEKNGIETYKVILLDCEDSIRNKRIHKRGQPELSNENMDNWAHFLKEDCQKNNCKIIDTTNLSVEEVADFLEKEIS